MRSRLPHCLVALCVASGALTLASAQDRDPKDERAGSSKTVTLQAESQPLLEVLRRLCTSQGYNFVADDAALQRAGKVTLSLTDVSFDDALEAICDAYGLEGRVRGLDSHPIVVIRLRVADRERFAADDQARERSERPPPRPSGRRFLEGIGPGAGAPKLERTPPTPAAPEPAAPAAPAGSGTAPVTSSQPSALLAPPASHASSGIVVGLVVELGTDSIELKEPTGDPRAFIVPTADVDPLRNERLTRGLAHLKKGDRVALEFRAENGRNVITNLVGGGKPPENP